MNTCSLIVAVGSGLAENRFFFNRLFRNTGYPFELIIVDNGTADGTASYLNELPNRKLIRFPVDMGLAKAWNSALRISTGKSIVFVRTSAVLPPGWLKTLVDEAEKNHRVGIVQAIDRLTMLRFPNIFKRFATQVESAGERRFASEEELAAAYPGGFDQFALTLGKRFGTCNIATSTAGCLLVSREVLRNTTRFTEGFSADPEAIKLFVSNVKGPYKVRVTARLYTHR